MMYLALYFPKLALELLGEQEVVLAISHQQRIFLSNHLAQEYGIYPGMSSNGAYALCSHLVLHEYDTISQQQALKRIANACLQFTSQVYIENSGLILEISGSLKFFSGLKNLNKNIQYYLRDLGYSCQYAVAPSILGAWWLAQAKPHTIAQRANLLSHLASLPVSVLDLAATEIQSLHKAGLKTIGQCQALPGAALRQRYTHVALLLEKAMGQIQDVRLGYQAPEFFHAHIPLAYSVDNNQALLFPLQRLVAELCAYLAVRAKAIQQFDIEFFHARQKKSRLCLSLLQATRQSKHLMALLKERLDDFHLPDGVESIRLQAQSFCEAGFENASLFSEKQKAQETTKLLERLQARLGHHRVQSLKLKHDYRPEQASVLTPPLQQTATPAHLPDKPRPFWLLTQAIPLGQQAHWQGPLHLLGSPERIETGWWDGQDVSREYYMAQTIHNSLVWIYRDAKGWFLQGFFS